ncbi:MAG: tail fiber domain-containing protein [Ferruginibacter sp.]
MKKHLLLLVSAIIFSNMVTAQSFAINTDGSTANASALLDVKSTTKGLLIPRMSKTERNAVASPATGLLVFQNAPDSIGFYYYDGSKWNWVAAINGNADTLSWKRIGNAATNPATHFIGTTDNRALNFKVNSVKSGLIDYASYNTAFGFSGQLNNTTGTHNTAIGYVSMNNNTLGNYNTSVGAFSFYTNTTGIRNTAIGTSALYFNNANDNTAVGYEALNLTSSAAAKWNTAVGSNAMRQNVSGNSNVAVGDSAGFGATASNFNVLLGKNAGYTNIGSWTTIIGIDAGRTNQSNGSVFIGSAAGMKNTSGAGNTFVGDNAGRDVTFASNNSFFGSFAGQATIGPGNSFFGRTAGYNNLSGINNVAMGTSALFTNSSGSNNVANGNSALFSNTTGFYNVAVGIAALARVTTQSNLVAIGDSSLYNNGLGASSFEAVYNTATGSRSLYANTLGSANTAIGHQAMEKNTTGNNNTFTGAFAGKNNITGSNNSFYGDYVGVNIKKSTANALFGSYAMGFDCDTSAYNSAFGAYAAGYFNKGEMNVFVGYNTANSLKVGNENTVLGFQASVGDTADLNVSIGSFAGGNGDENVFVGHDAGKHNNLGTMTGSTYVGSWAGFFKRANYSLLLGYSSSVLAEGYSNASAIGAFSRVDTSNAMVLGSNSINIGIGITKPYQAKLTISANNASSGSTIAMFGQGQKGISIQQNNPTIGWNQFRDISAANATRYMGTGFAWVNHMEPTTGNMYWNSMPSGTGGTAGGAETVRMTLTNTGSLGLNVIPNGNGQLQVQNTIDNRRIVLWENANTAIDFYGFGINSGTLRYQIPAVGNVHRFYAGNNLLFSIWGDGNAVLTGFLTTASDARLKKNITPINSTLDNLKKLNAYTYNWKDENRDKNQQIGLLAQEVEKVYPQLVKKDSAGIMSVNYSGFVPLLIKSMQEQQQTLDNMQKRMDLLEEQNKKLWQQLKLKTD